MHFCSGPLSGLYPQIRFFTLLLASIQHCSGEATTSLGFVISPSPELDVGHRGCESALSDLQRGITPRILRPQIMPRGTQHVPLGTVKVEFLASADVNKFVDGTAQLDIEYRVKVLCSRKERLPVAIGVREGNYLNGLVGADLGVSITVARHYLAEESLDRQALQHRLPHIGECRFDDAREGVTPVQNKHKDEQNALRPVIEPLGKSRSPARVFPGLGQPPYCSVYPVDVDVHRTRHYMLRHHNVKGVVPS